MSEEKNSDKQNKKEMVEPNERLSDLVFASQKEVKNSKEDTLINVQHLSMFKKMSAKSINNLNKEVETHLQATGDSIGNLESEGEKNNADNYSSFIKTLLSEDLAKKQNEIIEELKGKFRQKPQKTKSTSSFLTKVSFTLSLVSSSLLIFIYIKFQVFSQLF